MRRFSLRDLLKHARLTPKKAILDLHPELLSRLREQRRLADAISGRSSGGAARTLGMLLSGDLKYEHTYE